MNVQQIQFSKEQAAVALKEYKEHRAVYDARDWQIERIYREIAKGKTVISVVEAIRGAGFDAKSRPRLAVGRADATKIRCNVSRHDLCFDNPDQRNSWTYKFGIETGSGWQSLRAEVPRVPPKHRPSRGLQNYWILWEADWEAIPTDPYLLRRIGKDAWIVLAAWELTPVEVAVLRTTN